MTTRKFNLSSDREVRVAEAEKTLGEEATKAVTQVTALNELNIGEWCIFKNSPVPDHFFVGRILEFSYLTGKGQQRAYSKSSAPISAPAGVTPRGIGCMGTWYTVPYEGNGVFQCHLERTRYHDIDRYKCTVPRPQITVTNEGKRIISYSPNVIDAVRKIMKWRPRRPTAAQRAQTQQTTRTRQSSRISSQKP